MCVCYVYLYACVYDCVSVICFAVLEAIADDSTEVPQLLSDYLQSEGKLQWWGGVGGGGGVAMVIQWFSLHKTP